MQNVSVGRYYYLLLAPFIMWCLFPVLSFSTPFRLLCVFSLGLLFCVITLNKLVKEDFCLPLGWFLIVFLLVYIWIVNSLFSMPEFRLRHLHFSMTLVVALIAYSFLASGSKASRYIIVLVLVANIFTVLNTVMALYVDNNVSRYLSKSNELSEQLASAGVAGYGMVYANVLMVPICFMGIKIFKKNAGSIILLLFYLNLLCGLLFIIMAQYSIAIILAMLSFFLVFYSSYSKKKPMLKVVLIMVPIVLFGLFLFEDLSLSELELLLEGTRYRSKLLDIVAFFETGVQLEDNSLGSRVYAYYKSIQVFLSNPLLGSLAFDFRLGAHSDVLDKFGQFGFFVGVCVLLSLVWFFDAVKSKGGRRYGKEIGACKVSTLMIAFLNTIPMEVGVVFILICALLVVDKENSVPVRGN